MSKVFIDMNVLVHAFDRADTDKQDISIRSFESLREDPDLRAVLSTQALC